MLKTLVLYYSYTGVTRQLARQLADEKGADILAVEERTRMPKVRAYSVGCLQAMRMEAGDIVPITKDLTVYDEIILMGPVWAGYPAPAVIAALDALPKGARVEVRMVSASGSSKARLKVAKRLAQKGCELKRYIDINRTKGLE